MYVTAIRATAARRRSSRMLLRLQKQNEREKWKNKKKAKQKPSVNQINSNKKKTKKKKEDRNREASAEQNVTIIILHTKLSTLYAYDTLAHHAQHRARAQTHTFDSIRLGDQGADRKINSKLKTMTQFSISTARLQKKATSTASSDIGAGIGFVLQRNAILLTAACLAAILSQNKNQF